MYMYMSFYGKKCTSQWIAQVLNTSVKQFPQFPTETATFVDNIFHSCMFSWRLPQQALHFEQSSHS